MNVTQEQLLELQQQGYETTWIHVEDSDSYETGVINISETLALFGNFAAFLTAVDEFIALNVMKSNGTRQTLLWICSFSKKC